MKRLFEYPKEYYNQIPQIRKNEIEIKQQMLRIIPPFKKLGNTGNR